MKQRREILFYSIIVLIGMATVWFISGLSAPTTPSDASGGVLESLAESFRTFLSFVHHHLTSQFGLLLAQIIVILIFARSVAWLFTKIGQPSVIGEILAGIILGPSIFGLFMPGAFSALFPVESLHNIRLLSQFGLIFFMFVIGMELELSEIRKTFRKTLIISHAGIIVPFVLGAVSAIFLFDKYGGEDTALLPFALFVGVSMAITAFPVLARIIQERGEMNSPLGIITLSSAANGDITAWCLIALIMAISQAGDATSTLFTLLFSGIYMAIMFLVVRPLFRIIGESYNTSEVAGKGIIALVFVTLLVSAYTTELLGLHALFGAFIAGVIMPEDLKFRRLLTEKVEDVSLSIFLPLFFVSSGLETQIGLLNTPLLWGVTLLLIIVAVLGKLGGSYIAARVVGESPSDSLYIGILMNTRGLMELVVLSMGYQLGILSPTIFAMLVLMTLVTTFMTTPLLDLSTRLLRRHKERQEGAPSENFNILFSFGRTSTGLLMLRVIQSLFPPHSRSYAVTGMHMTVGSDVNPIQAEHYRESNFRPIEEESQKSGLNLTERYEVSDNPTQSILRASSENACNLLLVGSGIDLSRTPHDMEINELRQKFKERFGLSISGAPSLFSAAQLLRDKTETFIKHATCPVGVVVDRGLTGTAKSILVVHHKGGEEESYPSLVQTLTSETEAELTCITIGTEKGNSPLPYSCTTIEQEQLLPHDEENHLRKYDLMIISYETWKNLCSKNPLIIAQIPTSILLSSKNTEKK